MICFFGRTAETSGNAYTDLDTDVRNGYRCKQKGSNGRRGHLQIFRPEQVSSAEMDLCVTLVAEIALRGKISRKFPACLSGEQDGISRTLPLQHA